MELQEELELQVEDDQNREIIAYLFQIVKGFKGPLKSLISSTNSSYNTAISIALGNHANLLVVESQEDAKQVNQLLKAKNISRELIILEKV